MRYPRLDESDPSQVDEGSLDIQYVSFEVRLRSSTTFRQKVVALLQDRSRLTPP